MQSTARRSPAPLLLAWFLLPLQPDVVDKPATAWRHAARWLPLWGLAIGIFYAALYRGTWKWFGEFHNLRLVPPVVLLIADFAFFGYRQIAAAVTLVDGRGSGTLKPTTDRAGLGLPGQLALVLIALLKFVMLVVLPIGAVVWPADWRQHLGPLYPGVIYRPLILMPLWGRWAMMLALSIGRVSSDGSERLRQMAGGARLLQIMGWWLLIALLTVAYSSPLVGHLRYGILIALAMLLVTYLTSFALARLCNGQTEATVSTAGLIGELAFLAAYLPAARAIHWY